MSENIDKVIRVGSRKSELALIQTKHVISRLQKLYPQKKFEIHTMSTIGDRVLNISLPKIGEKSLFTRDLEDALRNGGVDLVVHSLKDLPTSLPPGMAVGAILGREDSRDALVLNEKYKGMTIDTLPPGSVIGTSSLRRTAQLRRKYPHLEMCDIRGNLNTRLAKLDAPNSRFTGIILAQAGLIRMGWMNRISQVLEPAEILYAVGQGALAVECRSNDEEILKMLENLMCLETTCRILAERSFLKTLGGGCSAPVAVSTNINDSLENIKEYKKRLDITGAVWSLDGKTEIRDSINCCLDITKKKLSEKNANEENEDVSPRKRAKIEGEGNNANEKRGSPKIIDDDKFALDLDLGDASKLLDIQYLMDIHGELFKRCPFYALHLKDKENGNTSTKQECPLKVRVGEEFMGNCPYFNINQKVELAEHHEKPHSVNTEIVPEDEEGKNVIIQPSKAESNNLLVTKCPYSEVSSESEETKLKKTQINKLSHEDCPFLQKTIKLIDYENNVLANKQLPSIMLDDSEQLFCGLYRHKCYSLELFSKCEDLGKRLADSLIEKGALDVMKCAQKEIREKA